MASNVVAAVTALVAKGPNAAPYPCVPAALSNLCGYQGSAASGWRNHLGRRWGLRASMFGGRWPQYTHAQYKVLCGLAPGEVTAQGQVRALAVHKQAATRAGADTKALVPLHKVQAAGKQGAKQAKRAASKAPAPEPTAQAAPEPTAQAPQA
jgi:hypothetical protein